MYTWKSTLDNELKGIFRDREVNLRDQYSFQISKPFFFASDLDGTLVANDAENSCDMQRTRQLLYHLRHVRCPICYVTYHLRHVRCPICYVTGRTLNMTRQLLSEFDLIDPDWLICSLGSEIYDRNRRPIWKWNRRTTLCPVREKIMQLLKNFKGLTLQEMKRQGPGKCGYYSNCSESERVKNDVRRQLEATLPQLTIVTIIDDTTGTTLVDVISAKAGKSRAIFFISSDFGFQSNRIHYTGNSGDDLDALLSGISSTLVGNASSFIRSKILSEAKSLKNANVYLARACYGNGIIE
jgi:hydroxymethylpyrimidine pyrophosphatase-like HAD family hydrolase